LRTLILINILVFLSLFIYQSIERSHQSRTASVIAGLLILTLHASRKDKRFIRINFENGYTIFLIEYIVISLPLLIIFCLFNDWRNLIITSLIIFLVPAINLNTGSADIPSFLKLFNPFSSNLRLRFNIKIPFVKPEAFEWISGIRRYFIVFVPVYLIILAFSFKAYVAPIGLLVISAVISGFYFYGESRDFIELFSQNYKMFLILKIRLSVKYLFILFIPIVTIALIFQPSTWYFITGAIIIAAIIQIIAVIFKYALFSENSDLGHNSIIVFINVICVLVPFLWPLPIVMGIKYYLKAQNNLKNYLDDNN
jgi:hypothetical protein